MMRAMSTMTSLRDSAVGVRAGRLGERLKELELLDRSYTLAAQTFVALLPLILVIAAVLTSEGEESVVAEDLIRRFGLVGAGERAMRELIVVSQQGVYWLGAVIVLYSALSLSRRLGRAYNAIWGTPTLRAAEQWRGLVWIAIQVTMTFTVTELRTAYRDSGPVVGAVSVALMLAVWFGAETLTQRLFTRGAVARGRLMLAAGLVTVGRLGVILWALVYLPASLSRQAESYGPVGVVFGLFTFLFATWVAILGGTLLAAVLTEPTTGASGDGLPEGPTAADPA